jgi:hypothetical protein
MRTYAQAKAFAEHQHADPAATGWFDRCQVFSRQCVGAQPFGTSARLAFEGTPAAHRHTSSPPPPGAIAYYGKPGVGDGHAVFVVEGGMVWSTDILHHGRVDKVRWDVFPRGKPKGWSLPYRGWIDSCPAGVLPVQLGAAAVATGAGPAGHYRQDKKVYKSKMHLQQTDSDSVWNLQVALADKGDPVAGGPTGFYGPQTRDACAKFQRAQGWKGPDADGIAGPVTVARLGLVWVEG